MNVMTPNRVFLTSGIGLHEHELISFDCALDDAGIAPFNHVTVSSILPPNCSIINQEEGLKVLKNNHGSVVFSVQAKNSCYRTHSWNFQFPEDEFILASAVSIVSPVDENSCGYIAEWHGKINNSTSDPYSAVKEEAEKLVHSLALLRNIDIKKVETMCAITEPKEFVYTTVLAAAVFLQPCFR